MSARRITLESLEVLDAIDRKGSFAAAAASLYRVPSKVTYTVNKLEEDLGVTLFRKEGRRSVLTPAGRLLLEQGREILEAADRLVENTRQLDRGWESRLRIALDAVFDFGLLVEIIDEFCRMQPETEIDIREEVLGGSWEAIAMGRVDLVVGAPDEPVDRRGLEVEPFQEIPWVFAVAPTHPLAQYSEPLSREQQLEYRAIVVKDSSRELPALSRNVFERQQRILVTNIEHKIAAQCAGLGAGFLPRDRVEHLLRDGVLIEVPLVEPPETIESYLVWQKDNRGRALNWFVNRLLQR
ncbi:MAG: LysR substrate-binding domain-containing protein [Pseudomonadota bacterium]